MQLKDSQERFAESMVRDLQAVLPAAEPEPDLTEAVNAALRLAARASELTLAIGRAAATAAHLLFSVVAFLWPALIGLDAYALGNVVAAGVLCVGAFAFLIFVRRGASHPAFRRMIPMADAAALSLVFLIVRQSLEPAAGVPVGLLMVAIIACAMIAFSGSLRLSRSAARYSTAAGTLAAALVGLFSGLHALELLFVVAAVYATGMLSSRLTRMIRRLITNEIAQVQLGQMYREANNAAAAGKEILQIVSHDLRNPIHTIGMAADLMLDSPERRRQYDRTAAIIKRSTTRMNRLVQDLLDVTRLEQPTLAMELAVTPVDTLLADAADELEPLTREHGLGFTITSEAQLPQVLADRGRLFQVLANLVGNAVKFTPAGGHITIRAAAGEGHVRFAVSDTGPGIAADQLENLFSRFWQGRPGDRRGLGLGLTIAKAIVEAHHGEIGVESTIGAGSTFWFTVPVIAPH